MSSSRGSNPTNSTMDSHNDPDWSDPSWGEFPSNGNPHNTSNAPSPAPHVGSTFGTSSNHEYSSFASLDNLSPPLSHFGTHPPAPQWTGTNHPLLDSEVIASLYALCPRDSSSPQGPIIPTPSQPSPNQPSGSTLGSIPTVPLITYVPFQDHSTSPSFPHTMQSNISSLYPVYPEDPRRLRFGSYSGPTQYNPYYLLPPPGPYAPFNVGHSHPSRLEAQDGRPRFASLPVDPSQHVPQFSNLDYHGYQSSINPLTVSRIEAQDGRPRFASLPVGPSQHVPQFNNLDYHGHQPPINPLTVSCIETQDGRPRFASFPVVLSQHVPQFNLDYQGHQPSINHLTVRPPPVPRTASLSEGSCSSSCATLSPATSTTSFANPPSPSPSTVGGETFIWRLNSENPGWTCDCGHDVVKKKRHLESCPRNPMKPTIKCYYCPEIYTGGSRMSTLSGHIKRVHKDKLHLLKKRKN